MLDMIGINKLEFPEYIVNMTIAGDAIDGSINSWTSQGESAIVFSKFLENYMLLQEIIKQYKELALRDTGIINNVGIELINMDNNLLGFWR